LHSRNRIDLNECDALLQRVDGTAGVAASAAISYPDIAVTWRNDHSFKGAREKSKK
jgi:hypothetical protein